MFVFRKLTLRVQTNFRSQKGFEKTSSFVWFWKQPKSWQQFNVIPIPTEDNYQLGPLTNIEQLKKWKSKECLNDVINLI